MCAPIRKTARDLLSGLMGMAFHMLQAQPVQLVSQDGFTVSAETSKMETTKKHDAWNITIIVTTPAADAYFIVKKTGNILTDLSLDRYIKISVANHSGIFTSGDKYIKAEQANLVTTENNAVYVVKAVPYRESFEVEVPSGALPDLHASFIPSSFKELNYIPVVRSNDAELFAGTSPHGRRFMVYERPDTLLPPRHDNVFQLMDVKHKLITVTYTYDKFHIVGNAQLTQDTLLTAITYLDWSDKRMSARVSGNNFETSGKSDFTDAVTAQELHIRNADGDNRLVMIEKVQKHILVLGNTYPSDHTCSSSNGRYTLKVRADGNLVLSSTADGHELWISNVVPGKVMFSTIFSTTQFTVDIAGLSANTKHNADRPAYLAVANDGNLILYRRDGFATWQSNTSGK
jgi:hypothetical protein